MIDMVTYKLSLLSYFNSLCKFFLIILRKSYYWSLWLRNHLLIWSRWPHVRAWCTHWWLLSKIWLLMRESTSHWHSTSARSTSPWSSSVTSVITTPSLLVSHVWLLLLLLHLHVHVILVRIRLSKLLLLLKLSHLFLLLSCCSCFQ